MYISIKMGTKLKWNSQNKVISLYCSLIRIYILSIIFFFFVLYEKNKIILEMERKENIKNCHRLWQPDWLSFRTVSLYFHFILFYFYFNNIMFFFLFALYPAGYDICDEQFFFLHTIWYCCRKESIISMKAMDCSE